MWIPFLFKHLHCCLAKVFDLTVNSVESDAFSSFKQQVTLSKKLSGYILDIAIHLHRFFDNLIFADPLHCAPLMFVIFFYLRIAIIVSCLFVSFRSASLCTAWKFRLLMLIPATWNIFTTAFSSSSPLILLGSPPTSSMHSIPTWVLLLFWKSQKIILSCTKNHHHSPPPPPPPPPNFLLIVLLLFIHLLIYHYYYYYWYYYKYHCFYYLLIR